MSALSRFAAKRLLYLIAIALPAGVFVYGLLTGNSAVQPPKAAKGVLDLSTWDFEKQGNVPLNGEWAFYWKQLLKPADTIPTPHNYIRVPGIWNGYAQDHTKLGASGCATYVLDVKLRDTTSMLALNMLTVSNAYKLWVNDKLVDTCGLVGDALEKSAPAYEPKVLSITPHSNHLRFVMQVSNFVHCKGGFWLPLKIGKVEAISKERDGRVLLEMFLFGCLFILAIYHFTLYFLRPVDRSTLYFGLMCLVIGVRSLLTGQNLINDMLPHFDWFLARKIEYMLTFTSAPIYVAFAYILYRNSWNKTIYRIIVGFGFALCLFVLVTPPSLYTNTSYVFTGYAWLTGMYTIIVFIRAARKKEDGAEIFLATSLFFLLTIVNDTLNQLELVHTGLYLSFGLLIVTFAQSFVLSSRSATAFRNTEIYARTFRKFVPAQFLDKIAKDGIESIRPGNAEKEEVTVLFSDIRSFTSFAETLSPDEVFQTLNQYLSFVEPPIRANNGFVDKYMGDGIMALFEGAADQNSARNAMLAALDMQVALKRFNDQREAQGLVALRTGIGLHAGPVIIGTLGGNERMDSTAIGDAVNLASRIEGMTKMYGVSLLASDYTIRLLNQPEEFLMRFVDNVMAKGKNEPAAIWQIIGRRSDAALVLWLEVLPLYEKAIALYRERNIAEAKQVFESCRQRMPDDQLTKTYLDRCVKFLETGNTAHLDDVTSQENK